MAAAKGQFSLPALPPDQTIGLRVALVLGAFFGGVLSVSWGYYAFGGAVVALAAGGWSYLSWLHSRSIYGHYLLAAIDRMTRGNFAEARWLLDQASLNLCRRKVGVEVILLRVQLAFAEGNFEEAAKLAEEVSRAPLGKEDHLRASILSLRALALAALGNAAEARESARLAVTTKRFFREVDARARFTEAIVLTRTGDIEGLAAFLRLNVARLHRTLGGRERTALRALQRLVAPSNGGAYREPAESEEVATDVTSWAKRLVPEAADLVREQALATSFEPTRKSPRQPAVPIPRRPARSFASTLPTYVFFSGFIALVLAYRPVREWLEGGGSILESGRGTFGAYTGGFAGLVAVGYVVHRALRKRRATKGLDALATAQALLDDEQVGAARTLYERIARQSPPTEAARAWRALSDLAASTGDFAEAEQHARAGMAEIHADLMSYSAAQPLLQPALHAALAFALAGQRREDEAEAQLSTLYERFPTYPLLARSVFLTGLLSAVARQAFPEAAALARSRSIGLDLTWGTELLCDLLRLHANHPLPRGERARVIADLAYTPRLVALLERVAPELLPEELARKPRVGAHADESLADESRNDYGASTREARR